MHPRLFGRAWKLQVQGNSADEIVGLGTHADGPAGDGHVAKVGKGKFVLRKEREVFREIEVQASHRENTGTVKLIAVRIRAADELRLHVRDDGPKARPHVRLKTAEEIRATFARELS